MAWHVHVPWHVHHIRLAQYCRRINYMVYTCTYHGMYRSQVHNVEMHFFEPRFVCYKFLPILEDLALDHVHMQPWPRERRPQNCTAMHHTFCCSNHFLSAWFVVHTVYNPSLLLLKITPHNKMWHVLSHVIIQPKRILDTS